jgi:O-antigen ligase/tetratricopeptide (TPR) repeat protein
LVSLPIALYGIAQDLQSDPLPSLAPGATALRRVRSTLGHHIFLGGYLTMTMPLCAARLIEAVDAWRSGVAEGLSDGLQWLRAVCLVLIQTLLLATYLLLSGAYQQLWWVSLPVQCAYFLLVIWTAQLKPKMPVALAVAAYLGLLALQGITLALTLARGPWLGALGAIALFGWLLALRRRWRRLAVGVVVGACVVALFVAALNLRGGPLDPLKRYPTLKRLGSLSSVETGSIEYRLLLWESVVTLIRTQPNIGPAADAFGEWRWLIGYGPETLALTLEKVLLPRLGPAGTWRHIKDRAHNDLLQHIVESGLLGLATLLWLVAAFYGMAIKTLWRSEDRNQQLLAIALITAITAHLIELQTGIAVTITRLLFWSFLALGVVLLRALPSQAAVPEASEARWQTWFAAYLAATFLLLATQTTALRLGRVAAAVALGLLALPLAAIVASFSLGRASGDSCARGRNLWMYAVIAGLAALLIYHTTFRPLIADHFFAFGQLPSRHSVLPLGLQRAAATQPAEDTYHAALGDALAQAGFALWAERPGLKPSPDFQPSARLAYTLDPQAMEQVGGEGLLALAHASLAEAHRLQPLDSRHLFFLARLNHEWGARSRPERLDMALGYYQQAAELSPNRLSIIVNWAAAEVAKGRPAEGIILIRSAQAMGHDAWELRYALALAQYKMGNETEARNEAERAAHRNPGPEGSSLLKLFEEGNPSAGPLPFEEGPRKKQATTPPPD